PSTCFSSGSCLPSLDSARSQTRSSPLKLAGAPANRVVFRDVWGVASRRQRLTRARSLLKMQRPALTAAGPGRLVRLRPHRLRDAGLPAPQTRLGRLSRAEFGIGEQPHGCPRLVLDLGLTLGRATEAAVRESTRALHELEELLLGDAADGMRFASILGCLKQRGLDLVECFPDHGTEPIDLGGRLAARAACRHHLPRGHVARADFEAQRHTLGLPLEILGAGFEAVPGIELHTDAGSRELFLHLAPNR